MSLSTRSVSIGPATTGEMPALLSDGSHVAEATVDLDGFRCAALRERGVDEGQASALTSKDGAVLRNQLVAEHVELFEGSNGLVAGDL